MPEIKLDPNTLPEPGRKVKFFDLRSEEWYEGYYIPEEEIFFIGFEDSGDFIDAFKVLEWEYL